MSQQINLANPQLLKPRHAFGLREMLVGAAAALVAMLAWGGYLAHDAADRERQAEAVEARQATARQTLDRLTATATRAASPLLTARIETVQAHITERETLLSALDATLHRTSTGFSGRMTALAHSTLDGVWLTGFTLAADRVELKGSVRHAGLLTTYIDRLGKQASFAGTSFSGLTARESATRGVRDSAGDVPEHLDFTLNAGSAKTEATP